MPKEIVKVDGDMSWMTEFIEDDHSLDELSQYRKLPAIRPVQGTDDMMVKEAIGEGRTCLFPGNVMVADKGEHFRFVPLFMYTDWIQWRDRQDPTKPKMIAKSHDRTSDIAIKASDFKTRSEPYGEANVGYRYNFTQSWRFAGIVYGNNELAGECCTMSFSKGEFRNGEDLISAITARKVKIREIEDEDEPGVMIPVMKQIPLYGQVWAFKSAHREEGDKNWWGFDWSIPEGRTTVRPEEMAGFKKEHLALKDKFDKGKLTVDDSAEEEVEADVVDAKTSSFGS